MNNNDSNDNSSPPDPTMNSQFANTLSTEEAREARLVQKVSDRMFASMRKAGLLDKQLSAGIPYDRTQVPNTPVSNAGLDVETLRNLIREELGALNAGHAPLPAGRPSAPPPPSGPSFSDKGPAAASVARDPMAIIQHDPRKATQEDFRRLVRQHGEPRALQIWTEHTMDFLRTLKVRPGYNGR